MPVPPVVPFTPKLRTKAMTLHTPSQLSGHFNKAWRDQDHFLQYLARRHQVHHILDAVIPVKTGLAPRLRGDLYSLDWKQPHPPVENAYVRYLSTLNAPARGDRGNTITRQKLIAHYYAFVLAHLAGGGLSIARSAASVVPAGYVENSWYYNVVHADVLAKSILQEINDEACYWTLEQEQVCLDELDAAFCFGLQIIHQ